MKTVFISYSRTDATYADQVTSVLDNLNVSYFRDVKNIEWGKDVQNEVRVALGDCAAVLVIISPGSVKSQWVPYEIGYATALNKRILPFVTHVAVELPEYISRLNYVTELSDIRATFESPWVRDTLIQTSSETAQRLEAKYLEWWEEENRRRKSETVRFEGLNLFVDRQVFSPSTRMTHSTFLASEFLRELSGKRVLDLGTGCGVLAILAAKRGAKEVVAIDIDSEAVRNATKNVKKFRLDKKIRVLRGDLFSLKERLFEGELQGKFDLIVSNLPIAFGASAWSHLNADFAENVRRWAHSLRTYLTPTGNAYLSWASFGDQSIIARAFSDAGLNAREFSETTFGVKWQIFEVTVKEAARQDSHLANKEKHG